MIIHIVTHVARQIEGEYHMIKVLGAFTDKEKTLKFANNIQYQPAQIIEGVPCLVDVGILYDIELTE